MTTINGWLDVEPSSGSGTTVVTLSAPAYTELTDRTASLRIEGAGGTVVYLTATQKKYEPDFYVTPSSLTYEWTGGDNTIQITSKYDWIIEVPDWIEVNASSGQQGTSSITVSVSINTTTNIRSGIIIFKDEDGTALGKVPVSQQISNLEGNIITYTTTDGEIIHPNYFLSHLVANYYENGIGYLVFDIKKTEIEDSAFIGENTLKTIEFVDGTSLGQYSLRGCSSLTEVNFSAIISMGSTVCGGCISLEGGIDLSNLEEIPYAAFQNCSAITSITIGSACTLIDGLAFENCSNLELIVSEAVTAPQYNTNNTFYNIKSGGTLVYPQGSDYYSWFEGNKSNLGTYGWNAPVYSPTELDFTTQSSYTVSIYTKGNSDWALEIPSWVHADITTGHSHSSYTVTFTSDKVYIEQEDTTIFITDDLYKDTRPDINSITLNYAISTDYPIPENNQILYIKEVDKVPDDFIEGLNWTAHTYNSETGIGVLEFSHPVDSISPGAFLTSKNSSILDLEALIFPSSVTIVNRAVFASNHTIGGLKRIIFGGNERYIGMLAFANNASLTEYALPNSLVFIQACSFYDAASGFRVEKPSSIDIGSNVKFLGGASFGDCDADRLNFWTSTPPDFSIVSTGSTMMDYGPFTESNYKQIHAPVGSDYSTYNEYGIDPSEIVYDLTEKPIDNPSELTVYPSLSEVNPDRGYNEATILVYSPQGIPTRTIENPSGNTVVNSCSRSYELKDNWYVYTVGTGNEGTATIKFSDSSGTEKETTVTVFRKSS